MKLEQATLNKWLEVFEQVDSLAEAGESIPDDLAVEVSRIVTQMRAMKARSDAAVQAARTRKTTPTRKNPFEGLYTEGLKDMKERLRVERESDPIRERLSQQDRSGVPWSAHESRKQEEE